MPPYRDALSSGRARVAQERERVDGLEERITKSLLARLPPRQARQIAKARGAVESLKASTEDLDELRAAEEALRRYAEGLTRAIAAAPELARDFNRLPRSYPEKNRGGREHWFPDIYDKTQRSLRATLHRQIQQADARAEIIDARDGYYDDSAYPFLVEARYWTRDAPVRLEVQARTIPEQSAQRGGGGWRVALRARYCLASRVRPSTPALTVHTSRATSTVLSWVGLVRDTSLGVPSFDEAFVVDGSEADAALVLRPNTRAALTALETAAAPVRLETSDTVVRISWTEQSIRTLSHGEPTVPFECTALEQALDVITAVRATPPTLLLRDT